jgi:Major Facilitator Superfamily
LLSLLGTKPKSRGDCEATMAEYQQKRADQNQLLRADRALDAANFFLADVRDGLGPYLAIYLLTVQKWDEASIGVVMSIATAAGILAQTPAGALVDSTKCKRALMVAAGILVTAASLLLPWLPNFLPVAASQATAHAAGAVFGPAVAACALGIFGHQAFTKRIGRNETFNHAGNACAAMIAGAAAYLWGPSVVFYLLAAMSIASLLSVLAIPAGAIDHDLARGLHDRARLGGPAGAGGKPACGIVGASRASARRACPPKGAELASRRATGIGSRPSPPRACRAGREGAPPQSRDRRDRYGNSDRD